MSEGQILTFGRESDSPAKPEASYDLLVAFFIILFQEIEEFAPPRHESQEPPPRGKILAMGTELVGKVFNAVA